MNRTKHNSASVFSFAIVIVSLGCLLAEESYAQTCVGTSPRICADFIDGDNPDFPDEFNVIGDDIVLKKGANDWRVWSQVSASDTTPADFGSITLNPDVDEDEFEVQILNGFTSFWGAVDVGSLVLDGSANPDWVGFSSIAAGSWIFGSVDGDITLVDTSGGAGGKLDGLRIGGNVTGAITVPHVTGVNYITSSLGNVSGNILIEDITSSGNLVIFGSIAGNLTVSDTITAGDLSVYGNVPASSTVSIAEMTGDSNLIISVGAGISFDGDLFLGNGLSDAAMNVQIGMLDGKIDLNDFDVVGELRVDNGTIHERIINGGDVTGTVSLSYYPTKEFKGSATFDSVPVGGLIKTWTSGELSGQLNVIGSVAGAIVLEGPFNSGAQINIGVSVSGDITIPLDAEGSINIVKDLSGDVEIANDLTGSVTVDGDMSGDIQIDGDQSGSVTVVGALINAPLAGGGRILVAGESSGPIKVGEQTDSLTLIQVTGGLATGATIEINTTLGNFDAEGDIQVGLLSSIPPPPIDFDGCIRIYDDGAGLGGALDGDITISGCHDPSGENLMICIDGPVNGRVTLAQPSCTGVLATWGCPLPGCP